MNPRVFCKKVIRGIDEIFLSTALAAFGDQPGIRGLLFHAVFSDSEELSLNHILPQQRLTIYHYGKIFEYFLDLGYKFLSYADLTSKLSPRGKYIYVTFDDGYYNNVRILPVIEKYSIPVHIFVTTRNTVEGEKYWWDIVYQKQVQFGLSQRKIDAELQSLKRLKVEDIRRYILDNFGSDSFRAISDLDRPLSPEELCQLSKHELVTIGNHTRNHAIVTLLTEEELKSEIIQAREDSNEITGQDPVGFAFPNGNYRPKDLKLLRSMGIEFTMSSEPRNNKVSRNNEELGSSIMGRYCMNDHDLVWQASIIRVGISPFLVAQRIMAHMNS